jgi:hypothetical protein
MLNSLKTDSIQVKAPKDPGIAPIAVWVDRVTARFKGCKVKPGLWLIEFEEPQIIIPGRTDIQIEWRIVH